MTAAIICARGGSKRLPRKNVKLFCGLPLIAWSIIQASVSSLVDEVFVSTDDDEIEDIARKFGAQVIRRPDWPDADQAAANRPFLHAIKLIKESNPLFNTVITILPTMPINLPGDIDRGISLYRKYGADCIVPAIVRRETCIGKKISYNRARTILFDKKYGHIETLGYCICSPEYYIDYCESQVSDLDVDLDKIENWTRAEGYFFPVECWQYADVDTAEEFELAEIIMEHYILKGHGAEIYFEYLENNSKSYEDYSRYAGNSSQLDGGIK